MKVNLVNSSSIAPMNLSNSELARHIEHEFPNLTGSLKMMLNRLKGLNSGVPFESENDFSTYPCGCKDSEPDIVCCPKCGTKLEI